MSAPEFLRDEGGDGIRGVAVGIVTDNKDPGGMGRVKLSYPWRDAEDESNWARIATSMAGEDRGTYFLPEEGDEVLVAFEEGDIHHPYVLGALWNGEEKPPEDNADGKNDVRMIRSRGGHEIVLNDAESEGKVEITTSGGHTIVLDDSASRSEIVITDGKQNTIVLDSTGDGIEISSTTKLSLDAPLIEIQGRGNVSIEASGMLTLKGAVIQLN